MGGEIRSVGALSCHVVKCGEVGTEFAGRGVGGCVDRMEEGTTWARVLLKAAVGSGFLILQLVVVRW